MAQMVALQNDQESKSTTINLGLQRQVTGLATRLATNHHLDTQDSHGVDRGLVRPRRRVLAQLLMLPRSKIASVTGMQSRTWQSRTAPYRRYFSCS